MTVGTGRRKSRCSGSGQFVCLALALYAFFSPQVVEVGDDLKR